MNKSSVGLVAICLLAVAMAASAQGVSRGAINVTVEDPTGAVVPGATVLVEHAGRPAMRATTDERGQALFLALDIGFYSVRAEATGFKTAVATGVQVRLNERAAVRLVMEVGTVAQTVEVVGAAVGIDHSTTTTGANVPEILYQQVPLDRNVVNPIYIAPGVVEGGGTGFLNPSIAGASGLENLTLIDGVNTNNTAFGGFGVYSRVFGSIGSGVTTSFIEEIQVTTGGMEAQYGQIGGGVVSMVTKSGTNELHGAVYGYYQPSATQNKYKDPNLRRSTPTGYARQTEELDYGFELGGRLVEDHVFFFGSLNPVYKRFGMQAPFRTGGNPEPEYVYGALGVANLGTFERKRRTINYAGKLTFQVNPEHRIDASVFGDNNIQRFGPNRNTALLEFNVPTGDRFSRFDFSAVNWTLRYEGSVTPSWLLSASFGQNHSRFEEGGAGFLDRYRVQDRSQYNPLTNVIDPNLPANVERQGAGFFENQFGGADQIWDVNTTHLFNTAGWEHQFVGGFQFETASHEGIGAYTGPTTPLPAVPGIPSQFWGQPVQGGIYRVFSCEGFFGDNDCLGNVPPSEQVTLASPTPVGNFTTMGFAGFSIRGIFGGQNFDTSNDYTALYVQDDISLNKYLTVKLGLRWEQEKLKGRNVTLGFTQCPNGFATVGGQPLVQADTCTYSFTGNWAPRVGLVVDPWGDRRAKAYFSFGRHHERVPLDMAQRAIVGEQQHILLPLWYELDQSRGFTEFVVQPDVAHFLDIGFCCIITGQEPTVIAPGTKLQMLDEFLVGFEYEFPHGIVLSGRYQDRRLKRMLEDIQAPTAAEALAGFGGQYVIANPSRTTDVFNDIVMLTGGGFTPESGLFSGGDGDLDGFADPVRNYQAVDISIERRFRDNWQMVANWRISKLRGNFEGSFRNDNGQTDPNITSLYDFAFAGPGDPLEGQFEPGPLPNDRTHVVNFYGSYMFNEGSLNGLNLGMGWRIQSGRPLTPLAAHPVYANAGELPVLASGGRGGLGRTETTYPLDVHADYTWRIGERWRVKALFDIFNLTNQERALKLNDNLDLGLGAGGVPTPNPDFLLPGGPQAASSLELFQRPFTTRFALRVEF